MEINISRIDESTWSFEEAGVRFFLLAGTERALLIDTVWRRTTQRNWPES